MPSCAVTFSVTTDPAEANPEPGPYLRIDQWSLSGNTERLVA